MKKLLIAVLAVATLGSAANAKHAIERHWFWFHNNAQLEYEFLKYATSSHGLPTIDGVTTLDTLRQRYDHVMWNNQGVFNEHVGAEAACFFAIFHPDTAKESCDYTRYAALYDQFYQNWENR